jgi:hypothetical protein
VLSFVSFCFVLFFFLFFTFFLGLSLDYCDLVLDGYIGIS